MAKRVSVNTYVNSGPKCSEEGQTANVLQLVDEVLQTLNRALKR
jgi:hypothetical protein